MTYLEGTMKNDPLTSSGRGYHSQHGPYGHVMSDALLKSHHSSASVAMSQIVVVENHHFSAPFFIDF